MSRASKTPEALRQALAAHQAVLERMGVRHLALFGSRARGDARPDSDLDALVEMEPGSGGRLAAARAELAVSGALSEMCGLDVGVIERRRLDPAFAARIADDLIEVF